MPSRKRRRGGAQGQRAAGPNSGAPGPLKPWRWWTFPVYFSLSLGLFAGFNVGLLTPKRHWNESLIGLPFEALFAFGLAQFVTRPLTEMMLRRRAERSNRAGPSQR